LFWIKDDNNIRRKSQVPHHFRFLPAILDIQQTMLSSAVGPGRVHAASL